MVLALANDNYGEREERERERESTGYWTRTDFVPRRRKPTKRGEEEEGEKPSVCFTEFSGRSFPSNYPGLKDFRFSEGSRADILRIDRYFLAVNHRFLEIR